MDIPMRRPWIFWLGLLLLAPSFAFGRSSPDRLTLLITRGSRFDIARLAVLTDSLRRNGQTILVINEGGIRAWSVAVARGYASLMQDAGVDVVAPDIFNLVTGPDDIVNGFRHFSKIRPVCANLRDLRGNLLFPPYLIVKRANLNIGVTAVLDSLAARRMLHHEDEASLLFSISDPKEALDSALSYLKGKVDIVVVCTDYGLKALDSAPGVDLFVAGNTWATSTGRTGECLGLEDVYRLDLSLTKRGKNLPNSQDVSLRPLLPDSLFAERVHRFRERAEHDNDVLYDLANLVATDKCCFKRDTTDVLRSRKLQNLGMVAMQEPKHQNSRPGKLLGVNLTWKGDVPASLKWEYPFSDTVTPSAYSLYWHSPHLLYASISGGIERQQFKEPWSGVVPAGSLLEENLVAAMRSTADRYFSWEEQDSLAGLFKVTEPESVIQARLSRFSRQEERVLRVLELARFLEAQSTSGLTEKPSYWHRRGIVYASLQCNTEGKVLDATLLENNAWPSAGDSVLALVRAWPIPTQGHERQPDLTWPEVVPVAVDRRETRLKLGEAIDGDLLRQLDRGPLAVWFRNLVASDSTIGPGDFIDVGAQTLQLQQVGAIPAKELQVREPLGVLLPSPEHRWWLDPFPGARISDHGRIECSNNPGVRLFEKKPHGKTLEWEDADQQIDLGVWMDDSRVALAGWTRVDHPRISGQWVGFSVPTLWLLDLEAKTSRQFQGPPLSPVVFQKAWVGRVSAQASAFPRLTWSDQVH